MKYVRDLNNPISYFYKLAREKTESGKQNAKVRFDEHVPDMQPDYKVGDQVYIKDTQIKYTFLNSIQETKVKNRPYESIFRKVSYISGFFH